MIDNIPKSGTPEIPGTPPEVSPDIVQPSNPGIETGRPLDVPSIPPEIKPGTVHGPEIPKLPPDFTPEEMNGR